MFRLGGGFFIFSWIGYRDKGEDERESGVIGDFWVSVCVVGWIMGLFIGFRRGFWKRLGLGKEFNFSLGLYMINLRCSWVI